FCDKLKDNRDQLLPALDSWLKENKGAIEAKSKDFAVEIAKLDRDGFEKLRKEVESYDKDDEPCDKLKAKFKPEELASYAAINSGIVEAIKPARDAYAAKAKEIGVVLSPDDLEKFKP